MNCQVKNGFDRSFINDTKNNINEIIRQHLAIQESEMVQASLGMTKQMYNQIKDCLNEKDLLMMKLVQNEKELERICSPLGGIDKALNIIATVDEVQNNFECSDEDIQYYLDNRQHLNAKHKEEIQKILSEQNVKEL